MDEKDLLTPLLREKLLHKHVLADIKGPFRIPMSPEETFGSLLVYELFYQKESVKTVP